MDYQTFCSKAPEKFLKKSHLILNVEFPQTGIIENIYEKLTQEVWHEFMKNRQTTYNFCKKMQLWEQINSYIQSEFPHYGLFVTGCTLNGFGLKDNDVEMTLLERSSQSRDRKSAIACFQQVLQYLTKNDSIDSNDLVQSLVPKLNFHHKIYNLNVEVSYNNNNSIRYTHLLYCYSQVDWRVRPLVTIIKLWAKNKNINNPRYGTLSNYSLALMVIHFLQYGVKPAILPSLQILFKLKFESEIQRIDFFDQLQIPFHVMFPKNNQTLGELLIEFFHYYDSFEFNRYAMSIRLGVKIPRLQYQSDRLHEEGPVWWKCMCIEDPFDLTNTSKSVYDTLTFGEIKKIIKITYRNLRSTHQLSSIFASL